jgi:hypothetical protein
MPAAGLRKTLPLASLPAESGRQTCLVAITDTTVSANLPYAALFA